MPQASDLISTALNLAGRLGVGNKMAPAEGKACLDMLNRMIGSWNTSPLNIFTNRMDLWNTAVDKQDYTLGPGGFWDGPRPAKIVTANLLLPTGSIPPQKVRRHLDLWSDQDWADIRYQAVYTYPEGLYNDGNAPLSTIYFRPIPDAVYQIELFTWQAVPKFLTVDDECLLPDGYEDAIVNNLAVRAAALWQLPISPDVRNQAVLSLAAIQSLNASAPRLKTDPELREAEGWYNYLSGLVE